MAGGPFVKRGTHSKPCSTCKEDKPFSDFFKRKRSPDGLAYRCKDCSMQQALEWIAAKDKQERQQIYRQRDLKRKFGMTSEMYEAIFLAQHGVCAICQMPEQSNNKMSVDHNHITMCVRGLLCGRCNTALERLDSDPDWANKALNYLSNTVVENLVRVRN